jgi:glucose-6-phosphate 1-epimerase
MENGFEYITVTNEAASAKIALQGAHLFEYSAKESADYIWLSQESRFKEGEAIRGGIPLCWPRFGNRDASLPQHGFARTAKFSLLDVVEISPTLTQVRFGLKETQESLELWPFAFELEVVFEIGKQLSIAMHTKNCSQKQMMLTQALHTYFRVDDITKVKISGLEGIDFVDTLDNTIKKESEPIVIDKEIDRVYLGTKEKHIVLEDGSKKLSIDAKGSDSCIVWNPWIEKCAKMSAMQPEAYREFVCIESANAFDDARYLAPGEVHSLKVLYKEV